MSPRIIGVYGTRRIDPPHREQAGMTLLPLDFGYIWYGLDVALARDDAAICVMVGTPAIEGGRSTSSAQGGAASAWLARFRRNRDNAFEQTRGRFAIVVLELEAKRVWMASDRFATASLCFQSGATSVAFSDRADCVPGDRSDISAQAMFEYFYFHMIPAPRTVYASVERLPGATAVCWDQGRSTRRTYWQPRFVEKQKQDLPTLKARFRDVVQESVSREVDGRSIGAFLSGGTDSSTVAGMLCKALGRPARTFSIGFGTAGYDEVAYARIAAKHFGTDHHEHYVTPADLVEGIPRVATHFDQPFGNSSAVPAWICAGLARSTGVEKMLAGDGGDELFGGNARYAKQRIFGWYEHVPRALRSAVIEPLAALPGIERIAPLRKVASYVHQGKIPMPDRGELYNLLLRLGMNDVFSRGFLDSVATEAPLRAQQEHWHSIQADSLINRMLAFDWRFTLADSDLPKVTVTADLAGVDVGFPLLSDDLVDFSLSLPPEWKLRRLKLRWFFKEALRGFLPDAIIAKRKHGFGLPFGHWVVEDPALGRLAADALGAFASRGVVQPEFAKALLERWLPSHPGYYGEMVWIVLTLELWLRKHVPDWRFDAR